MRPSIFPSLYCIKMLLPHRFPCECTVMASASAVQVLAIYCIMLLEALHQQHHAGPSPYLETVTRTLSYHIRTRVTRDGDPEGIPGYKAETWTTRSISRYLAIPYQLAVLREAQRFPRFRYLRNCLYINQQLYTPTAQYTELRR